MAITYRGRVYREMGLNENALTDFTYAISLNKRYILAIAERALTYKRLKRYQEALADYDRFIALNERNSRAFANRGLVYLFIGRYQDALKDFDRAITLDEDSYWHRYFRALGYMVMGKTNEFEIELNSALRQLEADLEEVTEEDWRTGLNFDLALFRLVSGNVMNSEMQYRQLAVACPSWRLLQGAVDDLNDFLVVQPSNQVALRVRVLLETRIKELKKISVQ